MIIRRNRQCVEISLRIDVLSNLHSKSIIFEVSLKIDDWSKSHSKEIIFQNVTFIRWFVDLIHEIYDSLKCQSKSMCCRIFTQYSIIRQNSLKIIVLSSLHSICRSLTQNQYFVEILSKPMFYRKFTQIQCFVEIPLKTNDSSKLY